MNPLIEVGKEQAMSAPPRIGSKFLDAALSCARRGWRVFPLSPRSKVPPAGSRGFKDATTDEARIRGWWGERPDSNLGIATGGESGLFVLDVDLRHGGEDTLRNLEREHGPLPETVEVSTGGGGRHVYFAHPGGVIRCSAGRLGPGLDIRADGGYVVAPPSIHPDTGREYEWEFERRPGELSCAAVPPWLLDLIEDRRETTPIEDLIPKERRNSTLTSLAGTMRRRGMGAKEMLAALLVANRDRCRPPLGEREVERIVNSVSRYPAATVGQEPSESGDPLLWAPPVPLTHFNRPPFPPQALPGWLGEFVEAEATATQTPPDLAAMIALSVCAAALAKKVAVRIKEGYVEPVNIFTVTVLPPGNRKSAVFSDAAAPLEEHEACELERMGPEIAEAQTRFRIASEALKAAESQAGRAKPADRQACVSEAERLARDLEAMQVPALPRYVVDDCSAERLATLIRDQKGRIAVMAPEGDVFDLMAGRYSGNGAPNLGVYLRGHAGDALRVDRVNRPSEFVRSPALTMGLAVQPEVLRGLMMTPGFRGRGLVGRFLYSLPRSPLGSRDTDPPPMSAATRARYRQNVRTLLELPLAMDAEGSPTARDLCLDPSARLLHREFEAWLEPKLAEGGDLGHMTDWAGKLAGAVARIAGILHMVEHVGRLEPWNTAISGETMDRALAIGHYLLPHARAAYGEMGADEDLDDARYILSRIRGLEWREFPRRDLFQATKGRFKRVSMMEPALALLEEHEYIRQRLAADRDGPGRRPSPVYDVNPHLDDGSDGPLSGRHGVEKEPVGRDSEDIGNSETGGRPSGGSVSDDGSSGESSHVDSQYSQTGVSSLEAGVGAKRLLWLLLAFEAV